MYFSWYNFPQSLVFEIFSSYSVNLPKFSSFETWIFFPLLNAENLNLTDQNMLFRIHH